MSDTNAEATNASKRFSVVRGSSFQHLSADTAIVGEIHDALTINFLLDSVRTARVQWADGNAQPTRFGRERIIEEVASVRMSNNAANALALDILLELAVQGMSLKTLDDNLAIVRSTVEQRLAEPKQRDDD